MNAPKMHNGISWDEEQKACTVALGGQILGRFPTQLQALRALENGSGHALGTPHVKWCES